MFNTPRIVEMAVLEVECSYWIVFQMFQSFFSCGANLSIKRRISNIQITLCCDGVNKTMNKKRRKHFYCFQMKLIQ